VEWVDVQHPTVDVQHPTVDVQQPTTSRAGAPVLDDTAPPALAFRKAAAGAEPTRPVAPPPTKRKVPQSSEKSRKFVSMHKMHQENLAVLKNIETQIAALVHGVVDLAAAVREINNK
jgi:hypothetical protein